MGNKKDSRTNRLRPEGPFDDESSYINLQKEFNNTRYSRDRSIRQVKKCDTEEDNWDLEEGDMERLFEVVVRQVKRSEEASDEDNWDLEEGDMERLFEAVVRQVKRSEEASDLTD